MNEKSRKENREKVINDLVKKLTETGAPGHVIQLYSMQPDALYCAWLTGCAAAKRLVLDDEIEETEFDHVAMEFTKIIGVKISHGPPKPPGKSKLVIPEVKFPGGNGRN